MPINYPNGRPSSHFHSNKPKKKKEIRYGKRGMTLESDLSHSNEYYRANNIAIIHKKPTPVQIVKVNYPKRSAARITEAYYQKASTTDYNGIYKGFYIDFEAKETQNKTSFPLKNFHDHQIEHLKNCRKQGGICFAILYFSSLKRIFVLDIKQLCYYWNSQFDEKGAKSIPLAEIEKKSLEIHYGFAPRIPYLDAVDQMIDRRV